MRRFSVFRDDEISEYEEAIAAKGPYEAEDPDVFERLQCAGYRGILEGDYVMVPDDAAAAYRTLEDEGALKGRSRRSFLYDCLEAAGYLYGVAELGAIVRIYNQNCGDRISEQDIIDACEQLPEGYKILYCQAGSIFRCLCIRTPHIKSCGRYRLERIPYSQQGRDIRYRGAWLSAAG